MILNDMNWQSKNAMVLPLGRLVKILYGSTVVSFIFIQETMFCSLSAKLRTWQVVSLATTSQSTLIFSSKRNSYPIMLLTKNVHLFMQKI